VGDIPQAVRTALEERGEVPPAAVEFLDRLDGEYFGRVPPVAAANHARLAAELTHEKPARVSVEPRDGGRFDVSVVAFDYFAEFAILCGVLSAHGLDIESGHVHTCAAAPAPPTPPHHPRGPRRRPPARESARKIVDVFRVRPRRGDPDPAVLEAELLDLLRLVGESRGDEARERLNRRIAESLERQRGSAVALAPVLIDLDNPPGEPWTVMRVRGADTPGFLYALANGLAMRGIYVHSVLIESVDEEARDRFWIARRDGRRIESTADQEALRLAVVLIRQFTEFLPWAPDPALALKAFDQLLDRLMAEGPEAHELFQSPQGLREVARLLGSSAFLWEDFLRRQVDHLRPVLQGWETRPLRSREETRSALRTRLGEAKTPEEKKEALNGFKDEEMLLIDMKHLLDPEVSIEIFADALTDLADAVLGEATELCRVRIEAEHGRPRLPGGADCSLAVFGLGKYGGREMGYASDLELLFVYGGGGRTARTGIENGEFFERLVKDLKEMLEARAEGIFHLDLRLRPHGNKGPLATPLPLLAEYYSPGGGAAAFERQALLKLRPVTGNAGLVARVLEARNRFVWSDEPWNRENALHLRERQARELVPAGRTNVKYSRGCMIDVEYAVQYLQLLHGRDHPDLRVPSTLRALDGLRAAGIVSEDEAEILRSSYLFWRQVADAQRMVHGAASDLVLPEPGTEDLGFLARRLGYEAESWPQAGEAFLADAEGHRRRVLDFFNDRFTGVADDSQ